MSPNWTFLCTSPFAAHISWKWESTPLSGLKCTWLSWMHLRQAYLVGGDKNNYQWKHSWTTMLCRSMTKRSQWTFDRCFWCFCFGLLARRLLQSLWFLKVVELSLGIMESYRPLIMTLYRVKRHHKDLVLIAKNYIWEAQMNYKLTPCWPL